MGCSYLMWPQTDSYSNCFTFDKFSWWSPSGAGILAYIHPHGSAHFTCQGLWICMYASQGSYNFSLKNIRWSFTNSQASKVTNDLVQVGFMLKSKHKEWNRDELASLKLQVTSCLCSQIEGTVWRKGFKTERREQKGEKVGKRCRTVGTKHHFMSHFLYCCITNPFSLGERCWMILPCFHQKL